MGLLLSPYRPGDQGDVCFIDVACIHQTDVELMHRGIRSIGGFLLAARELRILWSSTYLTRLWCVAWKKSDVSEVEKIYVFLVGIWSKGWLIKVHP